ncbi:uncharacterized protein LOC122885154 isoform X3 [Siniperca chuatsi]|uniref:uncharacterized protein LOC122885154 isoform X3 n=2 Tax=Siniperca chuatsi TaxID=119488 RepID=UPI001CE0FD54|nr:uncharacterized protein LOC122885154 isoform X3 [Siniperca chuatsi]
MNKTFKYRLYGGSEFLLLAAMAYDSLYRSHTRHFHSTAARSSPYMYTLAASDQRSRLLIGSVRDLSPRQSRHPADPASRACRLSLALRLVGSATSTTPTSPEPARLVSIRSATSSILDRAGSRRPPTTANYSLPSYYLFNKDCVQLIVFCPVCSAFGP